LIKLWTVIMCLLLLTSCGLLKPSVRNDNLVPEKVVIQVINNLEMWCMDAESFKVLLKEAYR